MRRARIIAAVLAGSLTGLAQALDYRSVGEAAVLYDAPSVKARPLFVILRGTPVEIIVSLDTWSKVRDSKGDLAWIERRWLVERRTVQVRADGAQVRAEASESARLVFEAEADVLLEVVEAAIPGWVKVRHQDGAQGYVKVSQIWGI